MSFSEAVQSGFDHYVRFDGRAARPAFWWWVLFIVIVDIVVNIIDRGAFDTYVLTYIVALALFLPNLSVSIRRLHDTNHSGWWVLIGFIPIIGFIVLLVFYLTDSDPGENRFGPNPAGGVSS